MKLIASVLRLDRKSIRALKITDMYSLHRVVYSLYDDVRHENEKGGHIPSGILFAENGGDHLGRTLLLLSNREPASSVDGEHGEVASKVLPANFLSYTNYRFKVIVNPTRRNNASRKLEPIKGREQIKAWFMSRSAQSWGFKVDPASVELGAVNIQSFKDKKLNTVTMAQVMVSGVLQVEVQSKFEKSVAQGIGRGRAYGCGLLQVVPLY